MRTLLPGGLTLAELTVDVCAEIASGWVAGQQITARCGLSDEQLAALTVLAIRHVAAAGIIANVRQPGRDAAGNDGRKARDGNYGQPGADWM